MHALFETDWFLDSKKYGTPYIPKSFNEFMYLAEINAFYTYNKLRDYINTYYINAHCGIWGYLAIIRDALFIYLMYLYMSQMIVLIRGRGIIASVRTFIHAIGKRGFQVLLSIPPIRKKIDEELSKTTKKIEEELMQNDESLMQFKSLPEKGLDAAIVTKELDKLQDLKHSDWYNGRVSGAVYHGGNELLELQSEAYQKYSIANQLHPDVFPGVRKMESEIVSMVLRLFNAPEEGCGSTTSGGTESLLLAGLSAREYGKFYKNISKPEIIAPITVHAGIEKACYYFGMKLHKVDMDPVTFKVDVKKVEKLINGNTVLLVGSAPNFPHGIIDDIETLSNLAVKYKIPLHVDACLGSFIVSFLEKSKVHGDRPIPKFDFRLPGVTSISCDTHKYGFAPKGSSIVMYRNSKLRQCQYYILTDWTGGMYGSPTLAGSRPGALMVGCWATLVNFGEDNYAQSCREIVGASMKLKGAIKDHEVLSKYLEVIGDPIGPVVAFRVTESYRSTLSIYKIGECLSSKGWHFSTLQNPASLHFALTRLTVPVIGELIFDLVEVTNTALKDKSNSESEIAALYGVAGSVKTTGVAERVVVAFLDTLYKI